MAGRGIGIAVMNWRLFSLSLLGLALITGALSDVSHEGPPARYHGYWVLAADLHVHTFPLSATTLPPWDVAIEARRQGLHVIAIAGHNETISGKAGRWFAQRFGGPIVLPSEEIHGPEYHMVAAGIHETISWRLTASQAIDEIHRQGGVAIAAHPTEAGPFLADGAVDRLDGTEVCQPVAFTGVRFARYLQALYERSHAAAIGSSDYHGMGALGLCRTVVFAKERSEQGVLEAIRARRTVVVDRFGRAQGDPEFTPIAGTLRYYGAFTAPPAKGRSEARYSLFSLVDGLAGLLGLALSSRRTMK
jgi:predicted metal-dependent phosphoesterase TrpH